MSVTGRQRSARVPIRVRAAIRRHGFARRPDALRRALRARELRFTGGNRLRLFANGEEGLKAMLAAIRNARRRIHLESYILRTDITGQRIIDTLAAQAREGVAVRLLYDAFGSLAIDSGALAELRHAGADVVAFNPLRRFYPHWLPRRRDHRKLLIVDGQVGFIGGLNIGDEYNAGPQDGTRAWRDTHIQVEGPAVQELEAVFLESWFRADGPELPWGELLTAEPNPCGHDTCAVVADGPAYRRRVVRDLIVLALHTAGSEVQLTSPYFTRGEIEVFLGTAFLPMSTGSGHARLPIDPHDAFSGLDHGCGVVADAVRPLVEREDHVDPVVGGGLADPIGARPRNRLGLFEFFRIAVFEAEVIGCRQLVKGDQFRSQSGSRTDSSLDLGQVGLNLFGTSKLRHCYLDSHRPSLLFTKGNYHQFFVPVNGSGLPSGDRSIVPQRGHHLLGQQLHRGNRYLGGRPTPVGAEDKVVDAETIPPRQQLFDAVLGRADDEPAPRELVKRYVEGLVAG